MVAARRLTREEMYEQRRLFRCSKCTMVAGLEGFVWSRRLGISCQQCRTYVYVLAERGPSPYQDWPWPHEPKLTDDEALVLLSEHKENDGTIFLTLEDRPFYERLVQRRNEQGRTQWPKAR